MTDKPNCTWGNHCLSEWCCPNRIENMFCICARNFDEMLESCDHDTRLPGAREYLMRGVIEELENRLTTLHKKSYLERIDEYKKAIALIKGVTE